MGPQITTELPSSFYWGIGVLIFTNLGTFASLLVVIFKAGFFVAETRAGIRDSKDTAVRAHKRIDIIEAN